MIKLHNDFPIYLIKNFFVPFLNKKKIVNTVLENKSLYYNENNGYNFPIKKDYNDFFKKLYKKFYNLCEYRFVFTKNKKSKEICWSYVSDKNYFKEHWHNHLNSSTINAVYYLNVPKNDNVTIDFELNEKHFTYKISNYDLLIFPNYLNHKPNRCYKEGYRISINMEIICNESSKDIFKKIKLWQNK